MSASKPSPSIMTPKNSSRPAPKSCKPIFRGLVFVLSGNFGETRSHTDLQRWIINWGGMVQKEVTVETTHLICTIENYEKKVPHVKKAWKLGKRCKIVTFDFIEDCLVQKPEMYRKNAEKFHDISKTLLRAKRGLREQKCHEAKHLGDMAPWQKLGYKAFHIHWDPTFFEMKIILTRVSDDMKLVEKYTIIIFESNAKPHVYKVGAKYHKGNRAAAFYTSVEKLYCDAFCEFKKLFRQKTGIEWDKRCDGIEGGENDFLYLPPVGGRPVGLLPAGWVPPNQQVESSNTSELHHNVDSSDDERSEAPRRKQADSRAQMEISSSQEWESEPDAKPTTKSKLKPELKTEISDEEWQMLRLMAAA